MHREVGKTEIAFSITEFGDTEETWDEDGLLPSDGISLTTDELIDSPFVSGKGSKEISSWDRIRREKMTENVIRRIDTLTNAGVEEFVLSGDYVEDVARPVMILGYFICDSKAYLSQQIGRKLNEIDPNNDWNWRTTGSFGKHPMWTRDQVELWPVLRLPNKGLMFLKHEEFFHSNRALQKPKGVITIRR